MLKIYLDDVPNNLNVIRDVEKQFASLNLQCTEKEKEIVEKIEGGNLVNATSFIDRFGYKLYTSELCTGCKAALCVLNFNDSVIDLVECGLNARDVIISLCDTGAILIDTNSATISDEYFRHDILVQVGSYLFSSLDRLNDYLFNEYPFEPDLNTEGIVRIGVEESVKFS